MFHLRHPLSRPQQPLTWCGAEPEYAVLGHPGVETVTDRMTQETYKCASVAAPLMTEYEWIESVADNCASVCRECLHAVRSSRTVRKPVPPAEAALECDEAPPF